MKGRGLKGGSRWLSKVFRNEQEGALDGVAQWIERWPLKQRVAGSIPSQGTCLGCRSGPQYGTRKRQPHIDVSLSLSPSLPFCLENH